MIQTYFNIGIVFEGIFQVAYVQQQRMQTAAYASYSTLISAASFMIANFPQMILIEKQFEEINLENDYGTYPSDLQSFHPLYQVWTDFITSFVLKNQAVYQNNTLHILLQLPLKTKDYFESKYQKQFYKKQLQGNFQNLSFLEKMKILFEIKTVSKNQKKIALFSNDISALSGNLFIPRINVLGLILGCLYNNQQWKIFRIPNDKRNEIPSKQEILKFDVVILSGSSLSVLDQKPFINQSIKNLFEAFKQSQKLKILGFCFGHQSIAKYHGALVVKKERKGGVEIVHLDHQYLQKFKFLNPLKGITQIYLNQHHQDYVEQIPAGFYLIGNSNSCKVECIVSDNGRIFSSQFHGEYVTDYTQNYQKRIRKYNQTKLYDKFYILGQKQAYKSKDIQHSLLYRQCMRLFIEKSD